MAKKTRSKTETETKTTSKTTDPESKRPALVFERVLNAPVHKVWKALTDKDEMRQWYFNLSEFKPEVGYEFQFLATGKDGKSQFRHLCRITDVVINEKLAYSWRYDGYAGNSKIIFELFAEGEKTKVRLTHEGVETFPQDSTDFARENFVEGWTYILNISLKDHVEKRKLILFNMMTLDGFFEGPQKDIGWHLVDEEFNDFAKEQLQHDAGYLVFGRITYELMAAFWPTQQAKANSPVIAKLMNEIPKIVFSRSLTSVAWNNTRLVKENIYDEISNLKQQSNSDLLILGSAKLVSSLAEQGLVDEYRIMINPVILGAGTPLFKDMKTKLKLKLIKSKVFKSGNVLLVYQPLKN